MRKVWFENYKYDYQKCYCEKWSFFKWVCRYATDHRLRFLFWGRLSASNSILKSFARIKKKQYEKKFGLEMDFKNIQGGLLLMHPYNITVNSKTIIKGDCTIFKGVTIGSIRSGKKAGCPIIEKNTVFCVNSTIVGKIHIGSDVLIAPNSYVNFDVPDHSVVFGNPGIIKHCEDATKGYINSTVDI